MKQGKRAAVGTAILLVVSLGSCQGTSATVQIDRKVDIPGVPPIKIGISGTIGGDADHEFLPNPGLVGLCLINEYWDAEGDVTGQDSKPILGPGPLAGTIPSGSVFWASTVGPWEAADGSSPPVVPPPGLGEQLPFRERLHGLHEFTAFGGRVFLDIAGSNVDYAIKVLARDYTSARALVDAVVSAGAGASVSPFVVEAFLAVLEPDAATGELVLRVAALGEALEGYELFLNGALYASFALGLNVTVTTSEGWVSAESTIASGDLDLGSTPGEIYQNVALIRIDTDDTPVPWEVGILFEQVIE